MYTGTRVATNFKRMAPVNPKKVSSISFPSEFVQYFNDKLGKISFKFQVVVFLNNRVPDKSNHRET